eukprot:6175949-Pleurochrysis_carterae.AAC.3
MDTLFLLMLMGSTVGGSWTCYGAIVAHINANGRGESSLDADDAPFAGTNFDCKAVPWGCYSLRWLLSKFLGAYGQYRLLGVLANACIAYAFAVAHTPSVGDSNFEP